MKQYTEPQVTVVEFDKQVFTENNYQSWRMYDAQGNPTGDGGSVGIIGDDDSTIED